MSTRGYVAIKENGIYKYIYNHFESGLPDLGVTLYRYYRDPEKIRALISHGSTSIIGWCVENPANSYREYNETPVEERGTVFYFRESRWEDGGYDGKWEECRPKETEDIKDVLGGEYTYIYDTEKGKWQVACYLEGFKIRDLEETLHSEEILMKLFREIYLDEYIAPQCLKCMSA